MSSRKYSVIFMRDDQSVKRFRMSPAWLKLGLYFVILMVALAAAGSYFSYTFWRTNTKLMVDKKILEKKVSNAHIRLERLENVEKILQSNDPEELQALFGSLSIDEPAAAEPASQEQESREAEPAETEAVSVVPAAPPVDLTEIFAPVDDGKAKVEEFKVEFEGDNGKVTFNLNNVDQTEMFTGRAFIELVLNNGEIVPVSTSKADMTFQIQRFRQMSTNFSLPAGVDAKSLFGLKLKLKTSDGNVVFSKIYPLAGHMA